MRQCSANVAAIVPLMAAATVLGSVSAPVGHAESTLQYLNQWQVAHGAVVDGTGVGGLSGISYDPQRNVYYTISDDKSDHGRVRYYSVHLDISPKGIESGQVLGKQDLLNEAGTPFAPTDFTFDPPVLAPDPEAIAFDSRRQRLYWASEGFADRKEGRPVALLDPSVRIAGLDGTYQGQFDVPPVFSFNADQTTGPIANGVFEGLSLSPDGRYLFVAMEQSLYQDGPTADEDHTGLIRITKFDVDTREAVGQYAYQVEKARARTGFNGISDILALDDDSLLVIERAANMPEAIGVSIYRATVGAATDVLAMPALNDQPVTPMNKTLAVDLNAVPNLKPLDNIEGITLGPVLADGRQSVVLVSDDNFLPFEVTQFLAFAF